MKMAVLKSTQPSFHTGKRAVFYNITPYHGANAEVWRPGSSLDSQRTQEARGHRTGHLEAIVPLIA